MSQSADRTLAIAATTTALATLVAVALYQLHGIDGLPDPPGPWFASNRITSSQSAHPLGIPDSLPGLGSYAATLTLILLAHRSPTLRKVLRAKLLLDGGMAGFNVVRQVVVFRKLCSWCTGTALATAALVPAGLRYAKSFEDRDGLPQGPPPSIGDRYMYDEAR